MDQYKCLICLLSIVGFTFFIIGCASINPNINRANFDKLRTGMTITEIVEIMQERPTHTAVSRSKEPTCFTEGNRTSCYSQTIGEVWSLWKDSETTIKVRFDGEGLVEKRYIKK